MAILAPPTPPRGVATPPREKMIRLAAASAGEGIRQHTAALDAAASAKREADAEAAHAATALLREQLCAQLDAGASLRKEVRAVSETCTHMPIEPPHPTPPPPHARVGSLLLSLP